MATKRKVDNLLGLAVLSTVSQRPMHRYEMASLMKARGKDHDMDIKWGSLYTVVQNLAKHGFLEAIGSTRQGGRPERTVYRITPAGTAELVDWTRELISTPDVEHPRFAAGLSVLVAVDPREAIRLLTNRLDQLSEANAADRTGLAATAQEVPRLFFVEDEFRLAMREAEATWVRSLLDELNSGTFPMMTEWQAWHETHEVPPELAELAERGSTPEAY